MPTLSPPLTELRKFDKTPANSAGERSTATEPPLNLTPFYTDWLLRYTTSMATSVEASPLASSGPSVLERTDGGPATLTRGKGGRDKEKENIMPNRRMHLVFRFVLFRVIYRYFFSLQTKGSSQKRPRTMRYCYSRISFMFLYDFDQVPNNCVCVYSSPPSPLPIQPRKAPSL